MNPVDSPWLPWISRLYQCVRIGCDRRPRLRTDLDLAVLQHYLASLEPFTSVSHAALHCKGIHVWLHCWPQP